MQSCLHQNDLFICCFWLMPNWIYFEISYIICVSRNEWKRIFKRTSWFSWFLSFFGRFFIWGDLDPIFLDGWGWRCSLNCFIHCFNFISLYYNFTIINLIFYKCFKIGPKTKSQINNKYRIKTTSINCQ